ncbi:UNVERIFIED_CONTAM: hypothetical protein NY603_31790, partial [Bacteroidetes bacterium 56_B9]
CASRLNSSIDKFDRNVWALGMEPYDCALRNILWEEATETLYVLRVRPGSWFSSETIDLINCNFAGLLSTLNIIIP